MIEVVGWAFAGLAMATGVLFLTKMALRKPERRTAEDLMKRNSRKE